MSNTTTYSIKKAVKYDPTHTTALRNAFARDMNGRFNHIISSIRTGVNKNDCFGLRPNKLLSMQAIPSKAFAFLTNPQKIKAFMSWLDQQVKAGLVTVSEMEQIGSALSPLWTNMYITDSYKRGVIRARFELIQAGFKVPSIEETGGINVVMQNPFHIDRVGILFARVYSDLKGITDAMSSAIARILSQGMIDGDGPALLARKLVAAIDGTNAGTLGITDTLGRFIPAKRRAEMLARTEIIRAHHLANIQEYRNWGVLGIKVLGEWKTAGDDRVCSVCAPLEGKIFTLDEIEPMIPVHPMCRCIALPYLEN